MAEGTRWAWVVAAVVVAIGTGWLAPAPWPAGRGEASLSWQGHEIARRPFEAGDPQPLLLEGRAGDLDVRARLPAGVSTRGAVEARLAVTRAGEALRPDLQDVRLELRLADGRRELVPVLGWDASAGQLRARRHAPVDCALVLGLLAFVVVLWVSEALPLWVTSLLVPVVAVVTGVGGARDALAPFFHPIIALFFGGFLMARAMRKTGLDRRVALALVAGAGRSPATLFAALLAVSAFLSMWMSNTAATAMLVPIAIAVTEPIGHVGYRKAAVLGIAYAGTVGGVGSAIGTPANPLAIEFLGTFAGRQVSFADWFAFGLPFVLLFLPVMGTWLWWQSDVRVSRTSFAEARRIAVEERRELGRPSRQEWTVLAVFALVMAAWLTQTIHRVDTGIVAVAGAVLLAALGVLEDEDLGKISWPALLTFGGGIALGGFMLRSGTSDWVATRLAGLEGVPTLVGLAAVGALTLGLTAVASNTATAAMLVPLAIPLAGVLGIDPVQLVVVVAIASSIDFALVIGTPPTMIAYSTRLFRARDIFRTGLVLDVLGLVILITAVAWVWRLIGLL